MHILVVISKFLGKSRVVSVINQIKGPKDQTFVVPCWSTNSSTVQVHLRKELVDSTFPVTSRDRIWSATEHFQNCLNITRKENEYQPPC